MHSPNDTGVQLSHVFGTLDQKMMATELKFDSIVVISVSLNQTQTLDLF